MDHQKFNFSLIFDILSIRECWGQPLLLFWKLVDETQTSKPLKPTRHHNLLKLWILLPLRADLLCTVQYETPCTYYLPSHTQLYDCFQRPWLWFLQTYEIFGPQYFELGNLSCNFLKKIIVSIILTQKEELLDKKWIHQRIPMIQHKWSYSQSGSSWFDCNL